MKLFNIFELFDTLSEIDSISIHDYSGCNIGNKRHFIGDEWVEEIQDQVESFFFYMGTDYNYLKVYLVGHDRPNLFMESGM